MRTRSPHVSSHESVSEMVDRLKSAVSERENMPEHQELIELIESGRHVLAGAKALAYYTEPRFTEDTDYIVSGQTFARIRKWMRENNVEHQDLGLVIRFRSLGVNVIDARSHAVLEEILKRESVKPSPEALAAAKYISFINLHRGRRRLQDVADFAELVVLEDFDLPKLRAFLVGEYAAQCDEVEKLIRNIKEGKPITI